MRWPALRVLGGCPNPAFEFVWHAVLHTWTRQYEYHPHVHFIATGGGLNPQGRWIDAHPRFLVPVHALSPIFRARFRDGLRLHHPQLFAQVPPTVWTQDWVVHSEPVGAGHAALNYLARYVYRVAIGESAILAHTEDLITLRYRNPFRPNSLGNTPLLGSRWVRGMSRVVLYKTGVILSFCFVEFYMVPICSPFGNRVLGPHQGQDRVLGHQVNPADPDPIRPLQDPSNGCTTSGEARMRWARA